MTQLSRVIIHSVALMTFVVATSAVAAPPSTTKSKADSAVMERSKKKDPIDINSATLKDLRSLPGVGQVTARKIVEGRPYTSVEDLKVRKVLSVKTYDKIRDQISARGTVKAVPGPNPDLVESGSGKH